MPKSNGQMKAQTSPSDYRFRNPRRNGEVDGSQSSESRSRWLTMEVLAEELFLELDNDPNLRATAARVVRRMQKRGALSEPEACPTCGHAPSFKRFETPEPDPVHDHS